MPALICIYPYQKLCTGVKFSQAIFKEFSVVGKGKQRAMALPIIKSLGAKSLFLFSRLVLGDGEGLTGANPCMFEFTAGPALRT